MRVSTLRNIKRYIRPATHRLSSTMTSNINISTALHMQREDLAKAMGTAGLPETIAVVDVRDDDHVGGHIKGSIHAPSSHLDWKLPELVRDLKDKETVVFHCALSQQRGPKAAMRYLQQRERLLGISPSQTEGDGIQKVYILDGGFVRWQDKYGNDETLTEAYAPDIWREY